MALLLLVAGCSALKVPAPLAPPRESEAPVPPLDVAWRHDAGGAFGRAVVLPTSGGLLVATRQGEVLLVDVEGRRHGTVRVGEAVEGTPALVDGRLLVVPVAGGRYGLAGHDLVAGTRRWRALRDVAVEAGVGVAEGVAVAPALDGTVYAVDAATGAPRWTFEAPERTAFRASPVLLAGGHVAVADTRGRVSVLSVSDGAVVWTADAGAPVVETPGVGEGLLVVPTSRGRLVALDAATGAERWVFEAGTDYDRLSTPLVAGGGVFVGSSDGFLYRLDARTGEVAWRFASDGHVAAAPLLAGGVLYAGTLDERLVALDAATGAERWARRLDGRVKSAPVVLGGLVVVPAEPGVLWAFRRSGGEAVAATL